MSFPFNTTLLRRWQTNKQLRYALDDVADTLEGLVDRVLPAIDPDGELAVDDDTVFQEIRFAEVAQHQAIGTVTISGGSGTPTPTFVQADGAELDDAATEGIQGVLAIPPQWKGKRLRCKWTWAHSEAATTGNVTLRLFTLPVQVGEDDTGTNDVLTVTAVAAATNGDNEDLFQETDMGTVPIGTSDVMMLYQATRMGNLGADTFGAKIWAYTLSFANED